MLASLQAQEHTHQPPTVLAFGFFLSISQTLLVFLTIQPPTPRPLLLRRLQEVSRSVSDLPREPRTVLGGQTSDGHA